MPATTLAHSPRPAFARRAALAAACLVPLLAAAPPAPAEENVLELGFAGLLDRSNRKDLAPITLSSGKPLAEAPYELLSGHYYRIKVISDGSAEMAVAGAGFFRNVWVNEVVINDIEVRPMGMSSIEFDDEGEAEISFIAIVPGQYTLGIPGARGDTQLAHFTIR